MRVQNNRVRASYRKDIVPDCKFYRSPRNGRLYMRDYAGYFHGDCFDFAMMVGGKNYGQTLHKIAEQFRLISGSGIAFERKPAISEIVIAKEECTIQVRRMDWTKDHWNFWNTLDFKKSTLDLYKVTPVERVWVNDSQVFWYGVKREIAFAYWFGGSDYKIYFPRRRKSRFLHNNAGILQGWEQLPTVAPFCLITKSLKDVMKLFEFNIPAVAPMAETIIPDKQQMRELRQRFPLLFSLYDIDKIAGVLSMQRMKRSEGVTPLFFPRSYPKDFTDFYEKFRYEDTKLLVQQVMDYHL